MTADLAASLALTLLAALLVQSAGFLASLRSGRHSGVDVLWGLCFSVIAVLSAGLSHGAAVRRLLVPLLTVLWGVRLAVHIYRRNRGAGEDRRYAAMLNRRSGGGLRRSPIVRIYLTQGLSAWFISLPVQVAVVERSGLGLLSYLGISVWAVGVLFEAIGDHQLAVFRRDPRTQGQVLDTGLWRYTRHPNYFGDAAVWWGLFLLSLGHWIGLLTVLSPIAMTWLLAKGTGKPLLESDIGQRRPGYAAYVHQTSGFLPLPRKAR